MSKHTPGPWFAKRISGDWGVYDADSNLVAVPYGVEAHEEEPNARVLAAAPDMLAELKGAVSAIRDWARPTLGGTTPRPNDPLLEVMRKASAIIAKAEGK